MDELKRKTPFYQWCYERLWTDKINSLSLPLGTIFLASLSKVKIGRFGLSGERRFADSAASVAYPAQASTPLIGQ